MDLRYARIIAYDIEDDRTRRAVSAYLEGIGMRIQKSVYVVSVRPDRLSTVVETIRGLCGAADVVDIVPVCANCRKHSIRIAPEQPAAIVVMGGDPQ